MKAYIIQHWKGELSLAKSYWVNGVLVSLLFAVPLQIWAEMRTEPTPGEAIAIALLVMLGIPVTIWGLVGIWRSASRYTGWLWGVLAKIAVVIGALTGAGEISQFLQAFD